MEKQTGLASIGSAAKSSTLKPLGTRKRLMALSPSSEAGATCGAVFGPVGIISAAGAWTASMRTTEKAPTRAETALGLNINVGLITTTITASRGETRGQFVVPV